MNICSVPVKRLRAELQRLAAETGAVDEDGFVNIEYKYAAIPTAAKTIYDDKGNQIKPKEDKRNEQVAS